VTTQLTYAIKFVSDMARAVAFHRDQLGLPLKFESPEWSEFATGPTTLALHAASAEHPPGTVELGFGVADVRAFHRAKSAAGMTFTQLPRSEHGLVLASFVDSDGAQCGVSSPE
jgi:predicted enzyme related to lactoylglutathione lyase